MLANLHRVLIIDDNRIVRTILREFFEQLGVEVSEAGDGNKGLELAEEVAPQLMVIDLLIPGKSGFEVAEAIGRLDLRRPPVLFFYLLSAAAINVTGPLYSSPLVPLHPYPRIARRFRL